MTKRKVLICGASGFIGRNLFESLSQRDDLEVYGTYRTKKFSNDSHLMEVDLTKKDEVSKIVPGFDILIQAAAVTSGAKDVIERPYIHVTDNLIMNALLYQATYDNNIPHVIFLSCTVMYPSSDQPLKETDLDLNQEMYKHYFGGAWMKVYVEKLCEFYSRLGKTKFTVIRHSNIYGPYDRFNLEKSHVFAATITKVTTAQENKIIVWGQGKEQRDFLHIHDLQNFIECAIDKQINPFEIFNVGLGKGTSVSQLVEKVIQYSGKNLEIEYDISKPTIATKIVVDTSKAKEKFGWEAKIDIDEGIKKTLKWYREHVENK